MPRGYSFFEFEKDGCAPVCFAVRGFRKFTGLTAEDEDEDSGATDNSELFLFRPVAYRAPQPTDANAAHGVWFRHAVARVPGPWRQRLASAACGAPLSWHALPRYDTPL